MPIYTYQCDKRHRWEEQRSMADPFVDFSLESCPEGCRWDCDAPDGHSHAEKGRRVFNPGDMRPVFKGRGWARKDHKDASKP